ncbi:MAG: DUF664 domain-containing protein [Gemmatimonadales bacterium]
MIDAVRRCMFRELDSFAAELDGYPDEASVWADLPGFANSTGTLTLHVCGGLRHFIGAGMGGSSYVRDRDFEFSKRGVSRAELHLLLAVTRDEVARAFELFDEAKVGEPFPLEMGGHRLPTDRMLIHLAAHLGYHLGQADGHRRATTGERRSVGAMGLAAVVDGTN